MMLDSGAIREKTQRLEVINGCGGLHQSVFRTPDDPNPACDYRVTGWVGIVWSTEKSLMNTEAPVDHLESLRFLED